MASLITAIAEIEIPRGEWSDLIVSLCFNSTHEQMQVRLASLQTIGHICEDLNPDDINQDLKNKIMLALTSNITNDEAFAAPCKLAVKALLHSIPYTAANFEVQAERDFIMAKIFDALSNKEVEIRENAMQCLVEVGRQEYNYITHYFQKIAELTSKAALHDEGKVGAQGIEFWTTLAEEELARERKGANVMNYIKNCKDDLISLLLQGIKNVSIEDNDDDDEEWGVNMSSGCCLQKISMLLRNEVVQPVIAFVSSHILDPDWKNRYAALIALGAIAEGPEKVEFATILETSIGNLLNMFSDNSLKVREAISWVVNQICEHHAEVLVASV